MITQEIEIPREVPIMTLSHTVLFPQAMMPLYIFEPRYREMLSEVLAHNRVFAVAALDDSIEDAEIFETPHSVAGVGVIRACKQNLDGTSNLILQGLARVSLEKIVREEPFRMARIQQILSESGGSPQAIGGIQRGILHLVQTQARLGADIPQAIIQFLANIKEPENVLDLAISTLCSSSHLKQELLATRDIYPRYQRFKSFLEMEIENLKLDRKLKGFLDDDSIGNN